ncbi:MAG: glycoside hydrolase family 3 N-terminal domain-containing protein, partial [Acholeplasmataceae bacterium]|nr:glycoside hydrolase family 3 N-terminal domain-containing protein [Acholeplasmataceae bacterium]
MKYQKIIKEMTLEEKASLTSGQDFWQSQDIERFKIPKMFLADGPHGVRRQAAAADHLGLNESLKATCFPTAVSLANTWNTALIEKVGHALGSEAVSQKVNILLGPGTNIKRNPLCGRNFEYYSEDPYLSGKMVSAQIRGIQANGVSACVKHFAVNNQEERRMVIDSVIDERTLREIYLTPFEMAVKEGQVKTLMSAYNKVNGTFANENIHLLRTILREDWGFNGMIVTDWGGNNDRISGLIAGNDLEMPGNGGDTNKEIVDAINNKVLDEKYLDEAVDRILTINDSTTKALTNFQEKVDLEKNHQTAYEAAQEAIILLQNKNNILPLNDKDKVCIIGEFAENPRYQGAGSSIVNPTKLEKTLDFIAQYPLNYIGYAKGFKRYGKKSNKRLKEAIKLSQKADIIILYL